MGTIRLTKNAGEILPPAQTIYLISFKFIIVGVGSIFFIKASPAYIIALFVFPSLAASLRDLSQENTEEEEQY